jgi:hypothetical protein
MKNLILKMTVIGMLTFFTNVLKGQTWDIVCDNTQVCSGITVDVYDAFNNIIVSGVALPGGTSKFGGGGYWYLPIHSSSLCCFYRRNMYFYC